MKSPAVSRRPAPLCAAFLLFAALTLTGAGGQQAGREAQQNAAPAAADTGRAKYALVIGNGAYTSITRLNNPVNDANDMKAALEGLGFTVDLVLNGAQEQMESAVMRLRSRLSALRDSYGFFFYAGHAVQSGGENYLIPVDANIQSENFLRQKAVSVQAVLGELNDAGNALNIVVLDACRDNPYSWARSGSRGLQVVSNQPADSIIVYATSAGNTADDNPSGRNGLFTSHLLANLKTPGLSVRDLFDKTGADVRQASGGKQIPAVYSQFFDVAYLGTRPSTVVPGPAPRPAPVQPITPPPERPIPDNMRHIQGGTFTMGSPVEKAYYSDIYYDNEFPQHRVTVNGFYMGKYEVTQAEYQAVMGTNPSGNKGSNLPVENVSWYDAIEYCNRRSEREGLTPAYTIDKTRRDPNNRNNEDTLKWTVTWNRASNGYRLPTEAEWEYACRAGTTTPAYSEAGLDDLAWWMSNTIEVDCRTQPVGTRMPNAWGLYDMYGNVFEWCWDWYGDYGSEAQTNPVGASSGTGRVRRSSSTWTLEKVGWSACRADYTPSGVFDGLGFRIVCNVR
jgi:formylglycine-generating enzyme required for sulfatase activity